MFIKKKNKKNLLSYTQRVKIINSREKISFSYHREVKNSIFNVPVSNFTRRSITHYKCDGLHLNCIYGGLDSILLL